MSKIAKIAAASLFMIALAFGCAPQDVIKPCDAYSCGIGAYPAR